MLCLFTLALVFVAVPSVGIVSPFYNPDFPWLLVCSHSDTAWQDTLYLVQASPHLELPSKSSLVVDSYKLLQ